MALAFAREGADVLITYLPAEEETPSRRCLIEGAGRKAATVPGDIRRRTTAW